MPYSKELGVLRKAGRLRVRKISNDKLIDFASNDYLGLSQEKSLLKKMFDEIKQKTCHAPKSSQLVNGYHPVHQNFEEYLCAINNFESAIVVGSGFMANLALLEALPRKKDLLLLDEEYHASGVLASKLVSAQVKFFKHNDMNDLIEILKTQEYKRAIVGVEGIYSMSGDLVDKKVFEICDRYEAILVVDEAHSVGVVGEKLLGIFDFYNIVPKKNHIKMGTLGKAIGSYGAYILCSSHISEYLLNRAKSLIYTTAPSLLDIELARQGFLFIEKKVDFFKEEIKKRQDLVKNYFDFDMFGLIFPFEISCSDEVMKKQKELENIGFSVGAIRAPTVKKPILRIIPRVSVESKLFEKLCLSITKSKS
ncbi:MAG: pyridoxal phosphate-dependent aminotransferase family protein [Epsilonproteobacteria bacterium]|nr:pyridoxal phosphate-dependent aminotransferase family protein [Campylobacterota bacterium]